MASLKQLDFSRRPAEGEKSVAESVRSNPGLEELDITGGWFEDDDAEELGAALAHNTSLKKLRLFRCSFGGRGLRGITEALKTSTVLEHLYLSDVRGIVIGDAGAEHVADLLVSTSSLKHLHIPSCGVGEIGARTIADALKINTTLEYFNIAGNMIGHAGAAALAGALAVNSSLKQLNASDCGIGAVGSRAIADALKINTCLESLGLSFNRIGDAGAVALAGALAANSSLKELDVIDCGIGAVGSRAIADALKINTCLELLDLGVNEIGDAGAVALADALGTTTSLTEYLYLNFCDIGDEGALALGRAWGSNLALSMDFNLDTGSEDNCTRDEAVRVRACVLRRRELLLAFGMAMLERLGGGTEEQAGSTIESTRGSAYPMIG
jgi:Ran GTPase-activating protein (RanGAP) involved in mRNA processing and transport